MNKIRDPRDGRMILTMIDQRNMLGKDVTAWSNKDGSISVYRSSDSPHQEDWIHGLNVSNYKASMGYNN